VLTHSITTILWRLEKNAWCIFTRRNLFPKMSVIGAMKTTRRSSVRGGTRDETTITNMLVNIANYFQFRPLDKLVR